MSTSTVFRAALPGLALIIAAGAARAQAAQDCQDFTLAPAAQRTACDEAIEAATDPLERARLLVERAGTFRNEGEPAGVVDALADLAEAERLAPDADPRLRADLLYERAEALRSRGDLEAALVDVTEAERLAPGEGDAGSVTLRGEALNNLARSLYMARQHEKALPFLEEYLAENPEPTGSYTYDYILDAAAYAMAAEGRPDEAVDLFLRAADLGGPQWRTEYELLLTNLGFAPEPGEEG